MGHNHARVCNAGRPHSAAVRGPKHGAQAAQGYVLAAIGFRVHGLNQLHAHARGPWQNCSALRMVYAMVWLFSSVHSKFLISNNGTCTQGMVLLMSDCVSGVPCSRTAQTGWSYVSVHFFCVLSPSNSITPVCK